MDHFNTAEYFYVYILSRPNGRPFYVGKGRGTRIDAHEIEARKGCKCHKCRVIRKVWGSGQQIRKAIVFETPYEAQAFRHEAELIQQIGLKNLANVRAGETGFLANRRRYAAQWDANNYAYKMQLHQMGVKGKQLRTILRQRYREQLREAKHCRRYSPLGSVLRESYENEIWALKALMGRVQQASLFEDEKV